MVDEGTSLYSAKCTLVIDALAALKCERTPGNRRGGRKKADYETVQREARLAADWGQARESGVYKPDFAKQNKMTPKKLNALLNRVAKRKTRSDK